MIDINNDIDKEIRELALKEWIEFLKLCGSDAIITAKVNIMRKRGKSINQIARRLKITKSQVETRLKRSLTGVFPPESTGG